MVRDPYNACDLYLPMSHIAHNRQGDNLDGIASVESHMEADISADMVKAANEALSNINLTQLHGLSKELRDKVHVALICATVVDLSIPTDTAPEVRQMAISDVIQRCGKTIHEILRAFRPAADAMISKAAAL